MAQQAVRGLDGLIEKLHQLDAKMQRKLVRHALREAAKPIRDEAKRRAQLLDDPATPESIPRNIATRAMKKRDSNRAGGDAGVSVGVREDKGAPGGDTFYWRFLEFGTDKMPAHPFVRPAAETQQHAALAAFSKDLSQGIETSINSKGN